MGILQLYNADARGVVSARICPLPDCTEATVRREINGEFSLTFTMPRGAQFAEELLLGRAVKALVNEEGREQYFIVKSRRRSLTGGFEIYAEHQSYLFNGVLLGANTANPGGYVGVVFQAIRTYAVPSITDISTWTYSRTAGARADFPARPGPKTVTEMLKDHLIGSAGGELIMDGFNVEYVDRTGQDRGASYRYGVNLTEMDAEDILDNYASGIYPFWGAAGDESKPIVTIPGGIITLTGNYPIAYIVPVDLTDRFETQPTQQELQEAAEDYALVNKVEGVPLSIRVARARLEGDEPVDLGDAVKVVNTPWGIDSKTRIMAMDVDALRGRVKTVELGTINPGFPWAVRKMK